MYLRKQKSRSGRVWIRRNRFPRVFLGFLQPGSGVKHQASTKCPVTSVGDFSSPARTTSSVRQTAFVTVARIRPRPKSAGAYWPRSNRWLCGTPTRHRPTLEKLARRPELGVSLVIIRIRFDASETREYCRRHPSREAPGSLLTGVARLLGNLSGELRLPKKTDSGRYLAPEGCQKIFTGPSRGAAKPGTSAENRN